jgi:hypothetical protein
MIAATIETTFKWRNEKSRKLRSNVGIQQHLLIFVLNMLNSPLCFIFIVYILPLFPVEKQQKKTKLLND